MAFFVPDCTVSRAETGLVQLTFRDGDGQPLLSTEARSDTLGRTRIGTRCAFFAPDAPPAFQSVTLTGIGFDHTPLWHRTINREQLAPWAALP